MHSKHAFRVFGSVEFFKLLLSLTRKIKLRETDYFINAEMLNLLTVKSDEIVVFVIPNQTPWT